MLIKHFLAEGAIELFDAGVLVGFARLDALESRALSLSPLHEGLAQEIEPVVGTQHLRQCATALELLEYPYQSLFLVIGQVPLAPTQVLTILG